MNVGNDVLTILYYYLIIDCHVEHSHHILFEDSIERQIYLVYLNGIEIYIAQVYIWCVCWGRMNTYSTNISYLSTVVYVVDASAAYKLTIATYGSIGTEYDG